MQLFRWLGAGLLLLCGLAVGCVLRRFLRYRCAQAQAFLALLRTIHWQIDCFSTPQAGILAGCDRQLLFACGVTKDARPRDLPQLLQEVPLLLPEEMSALLAECARELGGSYRSEQLRCLEHYTARLAPMCERMRQELRGLERLATLLPLALCAALLLLLA